MKLSVCMITYNHEKYIAQAIDSVLMQEVNFDYEIVIGEDCSTDNTRGILLEYQKKYPNKIKLLLRDKNLGMMHNFVNTLNNCSGQYVALLEGDDYWTDSHKLQKQVDFLETHPDFVICFHNMNIIYEDDITESQVSNLHQNEVTNIEDIIKDWYIMTASMVYRNNIIREFPEWYYYVKNGDYALQLMLACYGKIYYIDEVMGVYRIHAKGVSNIIFHGNVLQNELVKLLLNFNQYTTRKYKKPVYFRISELYKILILRYRRQHKFINYVISLLKYLYYNPPRSYLELKSFIINLVIPSRIYYFLKSLNRILNPNRKSY